ncbi:MFS transporter, PCFT/HCP family, solute carrier family 46, member 3 [Schistosoma bovis]|uniref:MFS transporter, PCFT/HCP family, solute carrier family 46, member 3 n=1 Tax=Schistosoma bovis TaxID=6184 RepID=A0A430Q8T3_SCHBO|nr:MFS transporter, PCFT/HCP family, solute carrier family 46, member 3 [Schistosoma bovis]
MKSDLNIIDDQTKTTLSKNDIKVICILISMVIPFYTAVEISTFICDQFTFYSSTEIKLKQHDAQKQTSLVQSSNNFAAVAPGLISTLLVGYISDRFGRKIALGILIAGEAAQVVAVAVVVFFRLTPWALVASNVLEGLIGGGLLSAIAQFSVCITDLTNYDQLKKFTSIPKSVYERRRWIFLTLIDGLACLSLAIASMIAGSLIHTYGFNITMMVCILIYLPVIILIFFLPETNNVKQLKYDTEVNVYNHDKLPNNVHLTKMKLTCWQIFYQKIKQTIMTVISSNPVLIIILGILFIVSVSAMVDSPFVTVYLMSEPFWWNSRKLGLSNGITEACSALLSIIIVNILARIQLSQSTSLNNKNNHELNDDNDDDDNNLTENKINFKFQNTLFNLLIFALSLMFLNRIMMTIAYLFSSFTANIIVYIGLILSFASFISRIGLLISVSALPLVYSATLSHFPGAVFLVCASMLFVATCAAIIFLIK